MSFYSIKNLLYLDLVETAHSATFEILRELKQLLVLKLDLSDTTIRSQMPDVVTIGTSNVVDSNHSIHSGNGRDGHNDQENQWLIAFPMNLEYLHLSNFSNASQHVLNFNECRSLIAIVFKDSKIYRPELSHYDNPNVIGNEWNGAYRSIENCIIWPPSQYSVGCVLLDDR